jgi:hypothetical protein
MAHVPRKKTLEELKAEALAELERRGLTPKCGPWRIGFREASYSGAHLWQATSLAILAAIPSRFVFAE